MALSNNRLNASVATPFYPKSKTQYFSSTFDSSTWDEIQAEGGDYHAFPHVTQNADGRILASWMHQTQHTGSAAADVVCKYSDDGGATWSSKVIIYGTLNGTDTINPYFQCLGVDKSGRFVVIFNQYAANPGAGPALPYITRSYDGENWTPPELLSHSGGPSVASTIAPFGEIKLLPSGKLALVVYQGDNNWVGLIDDDVSESSVTYKLVVNSSSPAYSEGAFCALNEKIWFYFLRQDGAVNKIPYYTTTDGGTTWTSRNEVGTNGGTHDDFDSAGGGWIPQSAEVITLDGKPHVALFAGARDSGSGKIPDSPALKVFACNALDAITNAQQWQRIQQITFTDDGFDRDLYVGSIFDDVTGECFVVTHEETATDESRIVSTRFNLKEGYSNTITSDVRFNSVTVSYTDQVGRFHKIGKQVFGRIEINYTGLDTTDISGISLIVADFPWSVAKNGPCWADVENSTGLSFTAGDDVFCCFSASNAIVQIQKADGIGWAYNSGKIAASGKLIVHVQYETED